MNRHGFALLTALWTVAVLGLLVGVSLRLASVGAAVSRNRVALTRGGWAREACLEILLSTPLTEPSAGPPARPSASPPDHPSARHDLGRGTWCRVELEDAGARLDLNLAQPAALRTLLGNDSLADALLDWRDPDDIPRPLGAESAWYRGENRRPPRNAPFAAVNELRYVRGFTDSTVQSLAPFLTTRGAERLNLNAASGRLLATLPGFGFEAVQAVERGRLAGKPVSGADHLAGLLSPPAREALLAHHTELGRRAGYQTESYTAVVEGGVRGAAPVARAVVLLALNGNRLAVTRREVE